MSRKRKHKTHASSLAKWQEASTIVHDLISLAEQEGIEVNVNSVSAGLGDIQHVMLNFQGRRIMNWWPTKGTWWEPVNGRKGMSKVPQDVLRLALRNVPEPVPVGIHDYEPAEFTNCQVCGCTLRNEDEDRIGMCERCAAE